jgi:hypothetical protein
MIRAFDGLFRRAPKPLVLRNPAPGYRFSERSLRNLEGVHPDLVRVMHRAIAITEVDFTVIEGLRTRERQKKLVEKGASTTMNSRHLTGHAVDIVPFVDEDGDGDREISWHCRSTPSSPPSSFARRRRRACRSSGAATGSRSPTARTGSSHGRNIRRDLASAHLEMAARSPGRGVVLGRARRDRRARPLASRLGCSGLAGGARRRHPRRCRG